MGEKGKKVKSEIQLQIIESVHKLLRERDIKQADLARGIDMDPARMSRAMNKEGDAGFTMEMLIGIANYFDVSVDYLLGRNSISTADPVSNKDLCRRIMQLISSDIIRITDVIIEEDTYQPYEGDPQDFFYPYEYIKAKNKYKMFYFSNYKKLPAPEDLNEFEKDEISFECFTEGNYNEKGQELNSFIDYYLKFYDLYTKNGLEQSLFETAIEDRIKQMKY